MAATGANPEMDDFKGAVVFRSPVPWEKNGHGRTLDDDVLLEIRLYLSVKYGLDLTKDMVLDAVRGVACANRFHPVRDYLRGLEWDAVQRAETWLIDYFGAEDTPYVRAVSRTWLLGAVSRILTPGCKFDFMLILEGMQGLEKSTAFNLLAVKDEWFTPKGGVKVTPLKECYELDEVTHRIVGRADWLPYNRVHSFHGEVFRPAPGTNHSRRR